MIVVSAAYKAPMAPLQVQRKDSPPSNVVSEMKQLYAHAGRIFIFKDNGFGMKSEFQSKWIRDFTKQLKS